MPNRNYLRGRIKEWECQEILEKNGYSTIRASGSHGVFDVVAIDAITVRMIQCKREKDSKKKIEDPDKAYPEDAQKIRETKVPENVQRELWIWIDRVGWKKYRLHSAEKCTYWKLI